MENISTFATCVVPNLRGHFGSGKTRGDCSYLGQLEDDIIDLIQELKLEHKKIYLIGHSSGGGLAIRLGASRYHNYFAGYLLLAPAIPTAPTIKKENSWAKVSLSKILFISLLNGLGIKSLNHTKVIYFNIPSEFQNGSETLAYSFNLNSSYHPSISYKKEIAALNDHYLCLVGEDDELMLPNEYKKIMNEANIVILPNVNHLNIVNQSSVSQIIKDYITN